MKSIKNARPILLAMVLTIFCVPFLLAMTGCSPQEEKKPANYYTGEMQKKDEGPAKKKGPLNTE